MGDTRAEWDSMGAVDVPIQRRYGAQTARAVMNFPVTMPGYTIGERSELVRALLQIKLAAALANRQCGYLDERRATLIDRACGELLADADLVEDFPVHILHGGGGTSANMNANEVIAYVANSLDRHAAVDALDHVNKSQSTNDVYPTACRIALLDGVDRLVAALSRGEDALANLCERYGPYARLARTCLQDAVGTTFGAFFGAYLASWRRHGAELRRAGVGLSTVSLGGGIAGQPDPSPESYRRAVIDELRRVTGRSFVATQDFADAAQNPHDLLSLAHVLDALARTLLKQSQDLRFLSSGPDGGIGEIRLPAMQPGSSAMPGKVNPVIPEFVIQSAMQTVALAGACGMAAERGELDLNVWEGVFVHNLLSGLELCAAAVDVFAARCLNALEVDEDLNRARSQVLTAQVAKIVQADSYSKAQQRLGREIKRTGSSEDGGAKPDSDA